jgi:hypothetical protein
VAFCLLSIAPLAAQERELTVEELYLKNVELQLLREQAFTGDHDTKLSVLDDIEKRVKDGDANQDYLFILEFLSMEGILRRERESGHLTNYFPEVRRRAANLLGRLGGEQARRSLLTILVTDDEPMVIAEAAYGLGVIGKDEGYRSVQALDFVLAKQDYYSPDPNLAYAICLALEKIAQANGGIRDPAAYRALVRISQGPYIPTVRRKAMQTLEQLRQYQ